MTSLKSNKVGVEEKEKENTFPTPIIGSKAIQQKYAKNKDSDDEDEDEEAEWQKAWIHGQRSSSESLRIRPMCIFHRDSYIMVREYLAKG